MVTLSMFRYLDILAFPFKSIHLKLVRNSPASAPSCTSDDGSCAGGRGDCAICLATIAGGEETEDLRCRHAFHKLCLDKWLENRRRTCPLCRDYISSEQAATQDGGAGGASGGSSAELLVFYPFDDFGCDEDWWIR